MLHRCVLQSLMPFSTRFPASHSAKHPEGSEEKPGRSSGGKRGPREGCPEGSRGSRGSSEDAMQWHSARTPGTAELSVRRAKQAQRGSYSEEHQVFLLPKLMIWKQRRCPPFLAH